MSIKILCQMHILAVVYPLRSHADSQVAYSSPLTQTQQKSV